jgi:hypothetical protein
VKVSKLQGFRRQGRIHMQATEGQVAYICGLKEDMSRTSEKVMKTGVDVDAKSLESERKFLGSSKVIRYNISIYKFKRYVIFLCVVGYCCLHEIWLWEIDDFP